MANMQDENNQNESGGNGSAADPSAWIGLDSVAAIETGDQPLTKWVRNMHKCYRAFPF